MLVGIIADIGFYVPAPECIEAFVNGPLFISTSPKPAPEKVLAYLPVRESRKDQNGNREVELVFHGSSPEIKSRHSTATLVPGKRGNRRSWYWHQPLVHIQHENHVYNKSVGRGPNRNVDSPPTFSKCSQNETGHESAKGNSADELPDSGRWHQSVWTSTVVKPRIKENEFQHH